MTTPDAIALRAIVEARAELERLAGDLDTALTYIEDTERGAAVLWRCDLAGRVTYSRGRGLEGWGLENDSAVGSVIYDWPHPKGFHAALTQFETGDHTPVYVIQDAPLAAITGFTALLDAAGTLVGVAGASLPLEAATHEDDLPEVGRG